MKVKIKDDLKKSKIEFPSDKGKGGKVKDEAHLAKMKEVAATLNMDAFSQDTSVESIKTAFEFVLRSEPPARDEKGMKPEDMKQKTDKAKKGKPGKDEFKKMHERRNAPLMRCIWHFLNRDNYTEAQREAIESFEPDFMYKLVMFMHKRDFKGNHKFGDKSEKKATVTAKKDKKFSKAKAKKR